MRPSNFLILAALAMSLPATGADTTDRSSPFDSDAACMDRTTDASTGNCVVKDEGTPRHTYPPRPSPPNVAPTPAPAPVAAPPTVRKSATGK